MEIASIVRVKLPGHPSSYPVGRFEVYHMDLRTTDNPASDAEALAETFNRCRYDQSDNRLRYVVEIVGEESPERAPCERVARPANFGEVPASR